MCLWVFFDEARRRVVEAGIFGLSGSRIYLPREFRYVWPGVALNTVKTPKTVVLVDEVPMIKCFHEYLGHREIIISFHISFTMKVGMDSNFGNTATSC